MYRNTYVEININNLKYNVETLLNTYPDYDYYFGVVKGNCYGHTYGCVKYLIESGINYLAVSSLEEGILIRNKGIEVPILCLEPISISYIGECIKNNITITIHSMEYFQALKVLNIDGEVKVHLKIDSGMCRLGFTDKKDVLEVVEFINKSKNFMLEGIFTHFATSGINDKHWDKQLDNFKEITSLINLYKIPIVHLGRSLTLLNHKKIDFCNGIRLGIIMYGYDQTPKKGVGLKAKLRELRNSYNIKKLGISETITDIKERYKGAFSLYSEVIQVKKIKKGDCVGYGASYIADNEMYVAVIPIGYADGYSRHNKGSYVVINGNRCPILGDVNMGMVVVAVDDKVKTYDKVTLIGEGISIIEVARHNRTIVYEIMCMLNEDVPRVIKYNSKIVEIIEK